MESYFKEALEIVKAQASIRVMSEDEITAITKLASGFQSLSEGCNEPDDEAIIDPKKAIKEKSITCVVCGKSFKLLTKKHLASHRLTQEEYRERCGYKKGTPLACKSLQRARRNKMLDMKLWERRGQKPHSNEQPSMTEESK